MKTTCVLFVLASLIALATCTSVFCFNDNDCKCPSYETGFCGVPVGSTHIGNRCHCLGALNHCHDRCSSLNCPTRNKACVNNHCMCLINIGHR